MISKFTHPELQYYNHMCNFTPQEQLLFSFRAEGHTLDECCDLMNMDLSSIKRLSVKVNKKMIKVTSVVNMDRWIRENYS